MTTRPIEIGPTLDRIASVIMARLVTSSKVYRGTHCRVYTGHLSPAGYGCLGHLRVHRLIYAWVHGYDVPAGLVVDHRCHTRACCNPLHLRVCSQSSNAKRNAWAARDRCSRGHVYAEGTYRLKEITRRFVRRDGVREYTSKRVRVCITCQRLGRAERVRGEA